MKNFINCLVITLVAGTATAQTITQNQSSSITAEQFINQAALSGMKEVATGKIAKRKAQDKRVKDFGALMVDDHSKANTELMALAKSRSIKVPQQSDIMPSSSTMNNVGTTTGTNNTTGNTSGTSGTAGNNGSTTNSSGNTTTGTNNTGSGSTTGTGNGTTTGTGSGSTTTGAGTTATSGNTTQNNQANTQTTAAGGMNTMSGANDAMKMIKASDVSSAIQQLDGLSGSQFDTAYTQMMMNDHKNAIALFERGATSSDPDIKAYAIKHLPTLRSHEKHVQGLSSGTGNSGQNTGHGNTNKNNQ